MENELINPNPVVHARKETSKRKVRAPANVTQDNDDDVREPIDELEVFEHIRDITDPEHPYTLEQLNVVDDSLITVDDTKGRVKVNFTPTVAHCSMATLIGLSIRVRLMRALPQRFKVDIQVSPGSHSSEAAVNKQLNDKERVAAALENPNLLDMVNRCLASCDKGVRAPAAA